MKVLKVVEAPGVGKGVTACSSKVISCACFLVALIGRKTDSARPSKASVELLITISVSLISGLFRTTSVIGGGFKDDIGLLGRFFCLLASQASDVGTPLQ